MPTKNVNMSETLHSKHIGQNTPPPQKSVTHRKQTTKQAKGTSSIILNVAEDSRLDGRRGRRPLGVAVLIGPHYEPDRPNKLRLRETSRMKAANIMVKKQVKDMTARGSVPISTINSRHDDDTKSETQRSAA